MKMIGLYGVEKQDIVILLTKCLVYLGNKVLVLDASRKREMLCMFQTEGKKVLLEYQGVYYMEADPNRDIFLNENLKLKEFDVVFLNMCFFRFENWEPHIGRRFYFCDQQRHHLLLLSNFFQKEDSNALFFFRDIVPCKLMPHKLLKEYGLEIGKEQLFVSFLEDGDSKYKLLCQYDPASYYSKYSAVLQNFICIVLQIFHPELTESAVKRICKKTEKEDRRR